jgi:hypothetical protein
VARFARVLVFALGMVSIMPGMIFAVLVVVIGAHVFVVGSFIAMGRVSDGLVGARLGVLAGRFVAAYRRTAAAVAPAVGAAAAPTSGAPVYFVLGLAVGALFLGQQRLPVGDRDLVVVGMNFAECQEAMAVAAIFDERRLQRRFDPRYLGEIDVAAQLAPACRFEVELLDAVAADDHHPGLLRMGRVDKHLVGH